jgi:transcriptional regulator with XRE-family HTH domain
VSNSEYQLLLAQEEFILGATELIFELMEKASVTKAELARRVGRTRGYLTQLLDGNRNMTLRTLAELANALGYRPRLDAVLVTRRPRSATRN